MARFVTVGKYIINLDCIAKVETILGGDDIPEAHVYLTNGEYVLLKGGDAEGFLRFLAGAVPQGGAGGMTSTVVESGCGCDGG